MQDWHKLDFSAPIKEQALVNNDFIIRGIAISETTTHNGNKYIAEELEKAAPSLMGKPLLVDHDNRVESIKGRVMGSFFDPINKHIKFEAKIMDKNIQEMIKDGRLSSVSIGAYATDLIKEEDGSTIAKGLKIVELSLVAVPADELANFGMAMFKSLQIKESMVKENIYTDVRRSNEMAEEKVDERNDRYESALSENKKLSERLLELEQTNKSLQEEKRKSLINSYKKLCQEKKVKEKDVTNAGEETIRFLIEQLSELEIEEKIEKKELKSVISEDLKEFDDYVVESSDKRTAVWKMPNESERLRLHSFQTRKKIAW